MRTGRRRCLLHLSVSRLQPPIADVVPNGAAKEVRCLQHHARARLHSVLRHVSVVHAANRNLAAHRLKEAAEQVDNRALAPTRWSHQRDHFAGLHRQREVTQNGLAVLIAKVHMVEDNLAAQRPWITGPRLVKNIRHGIFQREDALG